MNLDGRSFRKLAYRTTFFISWTILVDETGYGEKQIAFMMYHLCFNVLSDAVYGILWGHRIPLWFIIYVSLSLAMLCMRGHRIPLFFSQHEIDGVSGQPQMWLMAGSKRSQLSPQTYLTETWNTKLFYINKNLKNHTNLFIRSVRQTHPTSRLWK